MDIAQAISKLCDTVNTLRNEASAMQAELKDLRSGEYLARVIGERDRYRKALHDVDALDPEAMVSGCSTDALRGLVMQMGRIARAALEANNEPT